MATSPPPSRLALAEVAARPFLDIAGDLNQSLVYLDAGAGELVHLSVGLSTLFGENILALSEASNLVEQGCANTMSARRGVYWFDRISVEI